MGKSRKRHDDIDVDAALKRMAAYCERNADRYLEVPCPPDLDMRGILAGNPERLAKEMNIGKYRLNRLRERSAKRIRMFTSSKIPG